MATVTHFFGQPTYDWRNALDDALFNGNLSPVGAAPLTTLNLTSGTNVLVINGTGLVASNSGTLSAGTITGFTLRVGGVTILTETGFGSAIGFAAFNTLMQAYNGGTQEDRDNAWDLTFGKEGLTVNGSNAEYENLRGSKFDDTINTNGGSDGEFVQGSAGTDTLNGGSGYTNLGFHGLGGSVTVQMNTSGVSGGGTVSGTIDDGAVNTTFKNIERVVGTENADTFEAMVGFEPSPDENFSWVGGGGNDTFSNFGAAEIEVNYDAEKFEQGPDNIWGNAAGELGVIVNLSATSKTADLGAGNVTVAAGKARDTFGNTDTLIGIESFRLTDTKDFFYGNDAGIRIQARGGDDTLVGGAGRDRLEGQEGNDTISAGDGDDDIEGGSGNDTINAGDGTFDFILGGAGTDTVNGGLGYDDLDFEGQDAAGNVLSFTLNTSAAGGGTITGTLEGSAVNTTFQGIERLGGSNGVDTFIANVGFVATEDSNRSFEDVRGVAGIMEVVGGNGADIFTDNSGTAGGALMINYDDEQYQHPVQDNNWGNEPGEFGVIVNLSTASITANVGDGAETVAANRGRDTFGQFDTLTNIKALLLTNADDYVQAGAAGIYAEGRDGNDTLNGGNGNDRFNGDRDNDTLNGGGGADDLSGQEGNDTINGGSGNDRINGDDGVDTLSGGTGRDNISGGSFNDTLNGDAGNDRLNGDDGDDTLNGGANNDEMSGGQGNDTLNGGTESDRLFGDDGDDTLNGGTGADEMYGWMGDDTYFVDNIGDRIFEDNGTGTDTVNSFVTYSLAQSGEIEKLVLTGTADISGFGNSFANIITGNAGINTLAGGAGSDTLSGGDGADFLYGGLGNDILSGNVGADSFVFDTTLNGTTNVDTITSASSIDKFVLDNDIFTALGASFTVDEYRSIDTGTVFTSVDASDNIIYLKSTGQLFYDRDGSGTTYSRVLFADLADNTTLAFSQFLMVE